MKKSLKAAIATNLNEAISPAAAFISAAAPVSADQPPLAGIPEGMRLVAEPKSRRVHLLMRPTAYGWLEATAKAEGVSVNEKLNQLIEEAKRRAGK